MTTSTKGRVALGPSPAATAANVADDAPKGCPSCWCPVRTWPRQAVRLRGGTSKPYTLRGSARFSVGTVVMAQFNGAYVRGAIAAVHPSGTAADGTKSKVAYAIQIEPTGPGEGPKVVTAPVDLDVVVRKASAEEAARKNPYFDGTMVPPPQLNGPPPVPFDEDAPLRFKVNDLVMAFMGPSKGYIRAMIVGEKPKLKQQGRAERVQRHDLQPV